MCVSKPAGLGSLESGASLGAHSRPRASSAALAGRWVWGSCWPTWAEKFRSQPVPYHGSVLLYSSHLLPYRHLKLEPSPGGPQNLLTDAFLPGKTPPPWDNCLLLLGCLLPNPWASPVKAVVVYAGGGVQFCPRGHLAMCLRHFQWSH